MAKYILSLCDQPTSIICHEGIDVPVIFKTRKEAEDFLWGFDVLAVMLLEVREVTGDIILKRRENDESPEKND